MLVVIISTANIWERYHVLPHNIFNLCRLFFAILMWEQLKF